MQPNSPQVFPLPSAEDFLKSGDTSRWLKNALSKALERDPIDALNDAEFLLRVLEKSTEVLSLPSALDVLAAPAGGYSYWLLDRITEAQKRERVDLLMDVELLIGVLQNRVDKIMQPHIH